jgi:hypothetical protein
MESSWTKPLKMKVLWSVGMSGATNLVTQNHIPEDVNRLKHHCENHKSCTEQDFIGLNYSFCFEGHAESKRQAA